MKYVVKLRVTSAAHQLTTAEERKQIVEDALKIAEEKNMRAGEIGYFDTNDGCFTLVVQWRTMVVHFLTREEATTLRLPDRRETN